MRKKTTFTGLIQRSIGHCLQCRQQCLSMGHGMEMKGGCFQCNPRCTLFPVLYCSRWLGCYERFGAQVSVPSKSHSVRASVASQGLSSAATECCHQELSPSVITTLCSPAITMTPINPVNGRRRSGSCDPQLYLASSRQLCSREGQGEGRLRKWREVWVVVIIH